MIVSVQIKSFSNISKIKYVLNILNKHTLNTGLFHFEINIRNADLYIGYGSGFENQIRIIPEESLIFGKQSVNLNDLISNAYTCNSLTTYSIERIKKGKGIFFENNQYSFDWIEAIFFHLSRFEEYHCVESKKDQWGMMKESEQFLVKNSLYKIPVVDHIVLAIFSTLGPQRAPVQTPYILTHDIDVLLKFKNPYRFFRSFIRSWLDGHGSKGALRSIKIYLGVLLQNNKDPYDVFEWLLLERTITRNVKKIIYFMAGGETRHDNFYSIQSKKAKEVIGLAQKRGYSIGLHGSYNSCIKGDLFKKERKLLSMISRQNIIESRQHFLRFNFRKTPQILGKQKVSVDSTLGYQRLIGFRCGTGFDYPLFNFENQKPFNFLERPMIIMDGAMMEEAKNNEQEAIRIVQELLKENQENTQITFNFHNTFFDPLRRNEIILQKFYLNLFYGSND